MNDTAAHDTATVVRDHAHAYERALVEGDGNAAAAFFADTDDITRFGPEGAQYGADQVRNLRKSYSPVATPEWLYDEVVVLSPDAAIHKAVMQRGDVIVQRTQIWMLTTGWKIVHAHVSRVAEQ